MSHDPKAWGIVVIDTNVLVSALLKPGSVPDRALSLVWARARLAYDAEMLDEYVAVLSRERLGINPLRRDSLLERIRREGVEVASRAPFDGAMSDEDDRIFVEIAIAAGARALCTGNLRDYPETLPVPLLTPQMLLSELGG